MERKVLLETLADQLPPGSVRFDSKLAKIDRSNNGETMLELVDGTQLSAKVRLVLYFHFLNHYFSGSFQALFLTIFQTYGDIF